MTPKIGQYFTAVVIARNESERLPYVLENLENLANVVVVDNFSDDDTREITERFGRPWVQVKNKGGFVETPEVMDPIWAYVRTDYLLLCACAELVPPELLALYDEVSRAGYYYVVRADRISITAGLPIPIDLPPKWMRSRYPGEIRFFRRGAIDYSNNRVHDRGKVLVPDRQILRAPSEPIYSIRQFRDHDSSGTEEKLRVYDDTLARQKYDAGERWSAWKAFSASMKVFLSRYFLFGCFVYGVTGFIHAYYRFHMILTTAFRLYEIEHSLDTEHIKKANLEERQRFLKGWKAPSLGASSQM